MGISKIQFGLVIGFLFCVAFFFVSSSIIDKALSKFFFMSAQDIDAVYSEEPEWFHTQEYRKSNNLRQIEAQGLSSDRMEPEVAVISFSLVSNHPLSEKNLATGQALNFLNEIESGSLSLGKQWYDESEAYYLLKPIPNSASCISCHKNSKNVLCGAIVWKWPKGNLKTQMIGLVMGSVVLLLFLFLIIYLRTRGASERKYSIPLKNLEEFSEQVTMGDLQATLEPSDDPEFQKIEENLEKMKNSLRIALKKLSER